MYREHTQTHFISFVHFVCSFPQIYWSTIGLLVTWEQVSRSTFTLVSCMYTNENINTYIDILLFWSKLFITISIECKLLFLFNVQCVSERHGKKKNQLMGKIVETNSFHFRDHKRRQHEKWTNTFLFFFFSTFVSSGENINLFLFLMRIQTI